MDFAKLNDIKLKFRQEINSKRAMDSIENIQQLILILQKRKSIYDFSILGINNGQPTSGNHIKEQRNIIYMYICDNLGNKWKDFARNIGIKEGRIDDLERNGNSIQDNIYKILLQHEQSCDPVEWRQKLLSALENCRRKDMMKHVELVMDRFKINN